MIPQRAFDWLSEHLERALATYWGAGTYFLLCALSGALWGWDGVDRAIYVSGAVIIVLLVGTARRDNKAAQIKLDNLTPDETLNRLEEKSEADIERMRAE